MKYIITCFIVAIAIICAFYFYRNPKINIHFDNNISPDEIQIFICNEDYDEKKLFNQYLKFDFEEYKYSINLNFIYKDKYFNNVKYWIDPNEQNNDYTLNFSFSQKKGQVVCNFSTQGLLRDFDHNKIIILDKELRNVNRSISCFK